MRLLQPGRKGRRFANPLPITRPAPPWGGDPQAEPGFREFWRWQRSRPPAPPPPQVEREGSRPLPAPPANGIRATWVGHSSVVLQMDGLTLLCDPVWSRRLAGGLVVPRLTPPGIEWAHLPRIDAVLVSHNHYDHLDAPTIQRIPRSTPVFCGLGMRAWFAARGFERVEELGWWDAAKLDGAKLTYVPAQHFSGRTFWDRDWTLWGGFVIEGREGNVAYFAGDSGYFAGFREIGERFPRIDLCMMPAGAYEPRWFMAPVHVDPSEAGQAFLDVRARTMMPIHWGTFRLADEGVDEPPRALEQWWGEKGLDRGRLRVLPLGGAVEML